MEKFLSGLVVGAIGLAGVALLMLLVGALFAFPVMWIWNWMMPELFALPTLTFWQSFWGTYMCSILFKGGSNNTTKK